MTGRGQVIRRAIHVSMLVVLAMAPFVIYVAVDRIKPVGTAPWPSPVAIIVEQAGAVRTVALVAQPSGDPVVVEFPPQTVLAVPGSGVLRARTAFGIGGPEMVARGLEGAFDIPVSYWIEARAMPAGNTIGGARLELERWSDPNLQARLEPLLERIRSGSVQVIPAPGEWSDDAGIRQFSAIKTSVRALVVDSAKASPVAVPVPTDTGKASPFSSPSPDPSPEPVVRADISVEVLNAGGPAGSATEAGNVLRDAGFGETRIGNFTGRSVKGIHVFYAEDPLDGQEVASALDAGDPEKLPDDLRTDFDVLVLVGR